MSNQATPKSRTYGGLSQDQRHAQRRQQFLEAGLQVFGTDGYRAATVRRLCREAKLTDRYFYQCCGDIESLLLAVYEQCMIDIKQKTAAAMLDAPPGLSIHEIVHSGLSAYMEALKDPRVARVCMVEIEGISPQATQVYNGYMRDFAQILLSLARKSSPGWEYLEEQQQEILGIALVGAVRQATTHWVLNNFEIDTEVVVQATTKVIVGLVELVNSEASQAC